VPTVQTQGCAVLANLTHDDAGGVLIMQKGGLEAIISAMNAHMSVAKLQGHGSRALLMLASSAGEKRAGIRQKGGIEAIVAGMNKHKQDLEVQSTGCGALGNLALEFDNKIAIRERGGIDAIFHALNSFKGNAGIQEEGTLALANVSGQSDNDAMIRQHGGIEIIVRGMNTHKTQKMLVNACAALVNMCGYDGNRVRIRDNGDRKRYESVQV
jgi:hypothetical protein